MSKTLNNKLKKSTVRLVFIALAFFLSLSFIMAFRTVSRAEQPLGNLTYISVKIEEGDTLNKIASRHLKDSGLNHTTLVREITRLNHLPSDQIRAGAYLVIPFMTDNL